MSSWSLLRLNPRLQDQYIDHVAENLPNVEMYFPTFKKVTRPHGKRKPVVVIQPVYPGYVFANMDMDGRTIHMMVSTPMKARFIKFGIGISIVPGRVIDELKRLERLNQLVREIRYINPYVRGVKVRIHTPVADIHAIVIRLLHSNRVKVDSPLGTMTVPLHQVSLLPPGNGGV